MLSHNLSSHPRITIFPHSPSARYYNSDLSIWLSVDPMSDKYPSTSPYTYCANNPVKLVDPNGREIWVGDYYYRDGNLYTKDGNIFSPTENSFEGKALNSLNKIYGTETGKTLLSPFVGQTGKDVTIKHVNDAKNPIQGKNNWTPDEKSISSGTIFWNPNGNKLPTTGGWATDESPDLGHEFSHAFDDLVSYNYKVGIYKELSTKEWKAVYRENLIRTELGLPLRTHYNTSVEHDYWHPSISAFDTKITQPPHMLKNGKPFFPNERLIKVY